MKAATTASGGGAVSTSQTLPRNFVALEGVSGVVAVEFPRQRGKVVGVGMRVVVQGEREAGQRTAVGFVSIGSACTKQWPTTRPRYLQVFGPGASPREKRFSCVFQETWGTIRSIYTYGRGVSKTTVLVIIKCRRMV